MTDENCQDAKHSLSLNQICDEMITIKGGFKVGDMIIYVSPNSYGKSVIAIEGESSSGIIWTAIQKQSTN